MRILHINDRSSEKGGADCHLLGVLRELAMDHEVSLAVGREDGTAEPPCPVHRVAALAQRTRAPVRDELDRLWRELRPDLLHVHNVVNPEALAWAAERPAVMTVQDHRLFCPGQGKLTAQGGVCREPMSAELCAGCFADAAYGAGILALTEARLAEVARLAALTVLSSYVRAELGAVGIEPSRIHVIPPFVYGLDRTTPPSGPPCVLFAGRLARTKGVDDAIAAWRRSGTDLPLVFAGTGPERGRLEAAGCEVLGWLPHPDLAGVYRRARALLLPSRWQEPFGIVGLEALSLGVPVVAFDSGGVREWHPGPGLVPWGDVDALAAALTDALARANPPAPPDRFARRPLMTALMSLYEGL